MLNQVSLRAYNNWQNFGNWTKNILNGKRVPPPPTHTHTHLNYIIFFNIVHIPDKPGQSHNTQDFESTLSEVRFFLQYLNVERVGVHFVR